jgi:hypothetical protein
MAEEQEKKVVMAAAAMAAVLVVLVSKLAVLLVPALVPVPELALSLLALLFLFWTTRVLRSCGQSWWNWNSSAQWCVVQSSAVLLVFASACNCRLAWPLLLLLLLRLLRRRRLLLLLLRWW